MRFDETAINDILMIATNINVNEDRRPKWLKALRDAEHPTCLYYNFLYEVCYQYRPLNILEIGTYCGTSAAHMAVSETSGNTVTTIDINPDALVQVTNACPSNVISIIANSADAIKLDNIKNTKFDIIYVDGWHDFNTTYNEYYLYRPLVKNGGLMIFDDVGLEMAGDEMNIFWKFVADPKYRVDYLHPNVGFGIVHKLDEIVVKSHRDIIAEASSLIESKRND